MKLAFFEPFAINVPHFERCLEIIETKLQEGHEITFFGCHASVAACAPNQFGKKAICRACIQRRKKGLSLLSQEITAKDFILLTAEQKEEIRQFIQSLDFKTIEDVKKITYDNFDLGFGVASSLISAFRTPKPNVVKYKSLFLRLIEHALSAYISLDNHLKEENFDAIYFFNGRFALVRAAMRIAEKHQIDFYAHEVGATINKYMLFKNAMPHDIDNTIKIVKEMWEQADPETRMEKGAAFYNNQRSGKVMDKRYHHVKNQEVGLLPENWDKQKLNIAIFNSSEDEFAAISSNRAGGVYPSQATGIKKIVEALSKQPNTHVYLRVHPNLKKASKENLTAIYQIAAENFTIIPPESKISSYDLVEHADRVVVFLSTIGAEAAFLNKPTLVLGKSFYMDLGSTYTPQTHEEVIELLTREELPPLDNTGVIQYGYYRKERGYPYQYYKPVNLFKGTFKDVEISPDKLTRLLKTISYKIQYLQKKW